MKVAALSHALRLSPTAIAAALDSRVVVFLSCCGQAVFCADAFFSPIDLFSLLFIIIVTRIAQMAIHMDG